MRTEPDFVGNQNYDQYRYFMFLAPQILNAHTIVETGLSIGHSTRIFLAALSQLSQPRQLHTYEIQPLPDTVAQIQSLGLPATWTLHAEDSTRGGWNGGPIDILYLDADHAKSNVEAELARFGDYAQKLVFTHDAVYTDNQRQGPTADALEEWATKRGWNTILLTANQGVAVAYP
jgi:predicted O-methyltransferase YrrM